jgi:RNA polymerase-binding transcription factor DksA
VDLGLLDELTTGLSEVQDALERLDKGTYGQCEHCGDQIDDALLESSPTVRLCAAHLPFGSQRGPGITEPEHQRTNIR